MVPPSHCIDENSAGGTLSVRGTGEDAEPSSRRVGIKAAAAAGVTTFRGRDPAARISLRKSSPAPIRLGSSPTLCVCVRLPQIPTRSISIFGGDGRTRALTMAARREKEKRKSVRYRI
jgi:hypothetical protein